MTFQRGDIVTTPIGRRWRVIVATPGRVWAHHSPTGVIAHHDPNDLTKVPLMTRLTESLLARIMRGGPIDDDGIDHETESLSQWQIDMRSDEMADRYERQIERNHP